MRRIFLLCGAILVAAALTMTIIIASSRPFTVFGTGADTLPSKLRVAAALNTQLVQQMTDIEGVSAEKTVAVGYNQGELIRGLALCKSTAEGVYSFSTALTFPDSMSSADAAQAANSAISKFVQVNHSGLKVTAATAKNLSSGRVIRFSGNTSGSILANFSDHTLYLSGSANGCYPLSQLPKTTDSELGTQ